MKKKYSKENILSALRRSSDNSKIDSDFKEKLKSDYMKSAKRNDLREYFTRRNILFGFSVFVVLGVSSLALFNRKPIIDDLYAEKYSPYLSQHDINRNDDDIIESTKDKESLSEAITISDEDRSTPVFSESPDRYEPQSLSGGSVNDNLDYAEFLDYLKSQNFEQNTSELYSERFLINVYDKYGSKVPFEDVVIEDSSGFKYQLHTYSNGQIYFYPKAYKYDKDSQNKVNVSMYKVYVDGRTYDMYDDENVWAINTNIDNRQNETVKLDLVFTIDTTGSMSDQIEKLQSTIISISDEISNSGQDIEIRYGLVAYRDRGDDYIVVKQHFTTSVNDFKQYLNNLSAAGGGDYAEDMNSALEATIEDLMWSEEDAIRLVFLLTDAPPHMDYGQQYTYETAMFRALEKGIKIYPLASSGLDNTEGELILRKIGAITNAEYLFITNNNGGTDYHVNDDQYSVSNLDSLIIDIIKDEIESL